VNPNINRYSTGSEAMVQRVNGSSRASLPAAAIRALIRAYQMTLSPFIGNQCRFHPSCSNYALEAVDRFGALKGCWLAAKRLGRCHPFHAGGFDPVPGTAGASDSLTELKEI
jgi:putative membrane protein insertion efficiency factor